MEIIFRKYTDGDVFADVDGNRIARKSLFTARVYREPYDDDEPFVYYKSRIEHCISCLSEAEQGYGIDECCHIHASFKNKKAENDYVKSLGFWKA